MKKVLINFANEKYRKTQKFNSWTAKYIAKFDEVIEFSPEKIPDNFIKDNQHIFDEPRGCGLWLWKPYFIDYELNRMNEGDVLFYSDSGAFFIGNVEQIIKSMANEDIWLYGLPLIEEQFTKPSVFGLMNCDNDDYKKTNQFSGTFMMFRNSCVSRTFVKEWLNYCRDFELLSPENGTGNPFISHREDQSILSILAKKHHITMHRDPSQYGVLPEKYKTKGRVFLPVKSDDTYKAILVHHRTKDLSPKIVMNQVLCAVLPRRVGLKFIKS